MLDKMTNSIDFQGQALVLRAERQRVLASNIANADTPGYKSRDFQFAQTLQASTRDTSNDSTGVGAMAIGSRPRLLGTTTAAGHIPLPVGSGRSTVELGYSAQTQPSLDNNTVDMNQERGKFVDNAVRYEATLRFINGTAKTMLSAIQGQ